MPASGSQVNSSFRAYADPSDLTILRDWRAIADCLNDDNTRPADKATVELHPLVTTALRWASGTIEAAVSTGARYRPEDLLEFLDQQVTPVNQGGDGVATSFVVGRELLVGLTCDLAFWWLWKRRKVGSKMEDVSGVIEAMDMLERLRLGERIFPISATQDAGLPDSVSLDSSRSVRPSVPVSQTAARYFGTRGNY